MVAPARGSAGDTSESQLNSVLGRGVQVLALVPPQKQILAIDSSDYTYTACLTSHVASDRYSSFSFHQEYNVSPRPICFPPTFSSDRRFVPLYAEQPLASPAAQTYGLSAGSFLTLGASVETERAPAKTSRNALVACVNGLGTLGVARRISVRSCKGCTGKRLTPCRR